MIITSLLLFVQTEKDLALRPRQSTLRDANGNVLHRATLHYDKMNRLTKFTEQASNLPYYTAYTYDKDNRATKITFDSDTNKVAYTYDNLGHVQKRVATVGESNYETTYEFVPGDTNKYGAGATTPLVKKITQPGFVFEYEYDERGNIISEKRYAPGAAEADKKETTYQYDALGQLIRVNDPHDTSAGASGTTWIYSYDLGGNIVSKSKNLYTTGDLVILIDHIPYTYGDSNWKDTNGRSTEPLLRNLRSRGSFI